jgi:mevalonate kinase
MLGARALAVPLKVGQHMEVFSNPGSGTLVWESTDPSGLWFHAGFVLPEMEILYASDALSAAFIAKSMKAALELNPGILSSETGLRIHTHLEFHRHWGFGSSSSLISNLAWWFDLELFDLFRKISSGSGYDVSCARASQPILYSLIDDRPSVEMVRFNPAFKTNLFFVYLGRKQDSQASVDHFLSSVNKKKDSIHAISALTNRMTLAGDLDEFMNLMNEHEEVISGMTGLEPAGKALFPDFRGAVKSLGAWGGDFVMAASSMPREQVCDYFRSKGLEVIFGYDELVL